MTPTDSRDGARIALTGWNRREPPRDHSVPIFTSRPRRAYDQASGLESEGRTMPMRSIEQDFKAIWDSRAGDRQVGHRHFWDRALSRRQLLGRTAGLAGVAV